MEYIKQEDLKDFHFLQVPRVIWKAKIKGQLNDLAFMIYVEFFDRLKVSAINNWIDKEGNVYIKYSYEELMKILELKSKGSIAKGIKCLLEYDLIKQKKGFNTSSIFYLSNILKLTEVHKCEHSSTRTETQKYTDVDANYNNCNYNNQINNNLYIKGTFPTEKILDIRYKSKDEFLKETEFNTDTNLYKISDIIYRNFLGQIGCNHYKLNKEQLEKMNEGIKLIDDCCEDWEKVNEVVRYYFKIERAYYTIQDLTNLNTLAYILDKTGIYNISERFDSDGKFQGII